MNSKSDGENLIRHNIVEFPKVTGWNFSVARIKGVAIGTGAESISAANDVREIQPLAFQSSNLKVDLVSLVSQRLLLFFVLFQSLRH